MYDVTPSSTPLERTAGPQLAASPASEAPVPQRTAHICFLAPSTWPMLSGDTKIPIIGGAEVQQSVLAPALAARGWRVSMICFDYGQPDETRVRGVTVYRMHKPGEGIPVLRFLHPRLTSLWSALKRVDADVYYQRTSAVYTGFMAYFCRKHRRGSIYAGASDVDFLPGREEIRYARDRKIFQWGLRNVDRLIAQNPQQQRAIKENYGRDSVIIPSTCMPGAGSRADPNGYVLWAAAVRPQKNAEMMLEIARRLPHVPIVIVGGPDAGKRQHEYYESIRAAAASLPNVRMAGFVPYAQVDQWFDGARLFVNTSRYEGFPNTFLQAWARGIPTVAFVDTGSRSADGAPPYEVVADVSEAAWKIDRLMKDDAAWRRASQRAAEHFRAHHSVDAVAAMYEREIAGVLAR